jgi:hypothetical protein
VAHCGYWQERKNPGIRNTEGVGGGYSKTDPKQRARVLPFVF